jgi:signal transduction histidine kinase
MTKLAEEVVATLGGASACGPRRLQLVAPDGGDRCEVLASVGEMKQVMVNLLINAFEATDPATGAVRAALRRVGDDVEFDVEDNGVGMDSATLERAFEPFFSGKRGDEPGARPGTGLGLSVTHAIVTDHGGRIWAESAGAGRGSRFVVRLPAIKDGAIGQLKAEVQK